MDKEKQTINEVRDPYQRSFSDDGLPIGYPEDNYEDNISDNNERIEDELPPT